MQLCNHWLQWVRHLGLACLGCWRSSWWFLYLLWSGGTFVLRADVLDILYPLRWSFLLAFPLLAIFIEFHDIVNNNITSLLIIVIFLPLSKWNFNQKFFDFFGKINGIIFGWEFLFRIPICNNEYLSEHIWFELLNTVFTTMIMNKIIHFSHASS